MADQLSNGIRAMFLALKEAGAPCGDLTAIAATMVRTICHEGIRVAQVPMTEVDAGISTALLPVPVDMVPMMIDQLDALKQHEYNNLVTSYPHNLASAAAAAAGKVLGPVHEQRSLEVKRRGDKSRHFVAQRKQFNWVQKQDHIVTDQSVRAEASAPDLAHRCGGTQINPIEIESDVFTLLQGMAAPLVPEVSNAGGILLGADSSWELAEPAHGKPRYSPLVDAEVAFAKYTYAQYQHDAAHSDIPARTPVAVRTIVGLEFGRIMRRGYDHYKDQYRVAFPDGSDHWVNVHHCHALPDVAGINV